MRKAGTRAEPSAAAACTRPRRLLRRLTLDDAAEASHTFALLMGDKVAPRRQLIEQYGSRLSLEQLDV